MWSNDHTTELKQTALDLVLQCHQGLDRKDIEFNDFPFI